MLVHFHTIDHSIHINFPLCLCVCVLLLLLPGTHALLISSSPGRGDAKSMNTVTIKLKKIASLAQNNKRIDEPAKPSPVHFTWKGCHFPTSGVENTFLRSQNASVWMKHVFYTNHQVHESRNVLLIRLMGVGKLTEPTINQPSRQFRLWASKAKFYSLGFSVTVAPSKTQK